MLARPTSPLSGALRWILAVALSIGIAACGGSDSDAQRSDVCGAKVRTLDRPTTKLTYRGADDVVADVPVLCERLKALDLASRVVGAGRDSIVIEVSSKHAAAAKAAARTGQIAFYDWEANVIGPRGKPDPSNPSVTGGVAAGQTASLELYDAVLRAAKPPANPEPDNARRGSRWYAVDQQARTVYGSGAATRAAALALVPAGERAQAKLHEVKSGTVVLRAESPDGGVAEHRWYVLRDDVALRGDAIENPAQRIDESPVASGAPIVTFDFTEAGAREFQAVTRELAARGARAVGVLPGRTIADANQHFAIVLDDQIVSVPFIDFKANPEGIDGSTGSQIQGGFTVASAKALATVLKTGPLEVPLELVVAPAP